MRFLSEILPHLFVVYEAKSLGYLLYRYGCPAMVKMDFRHCMVISSFDVTVRAMMGEQPWNRSYPASTRANPRAPAEGEEVWSVVCAHDPGPRLQRVSAKPSLQHTAGTHRDKSKINLQSKSHLDRHEKQRETPSILYKMVYSTLIKGQKCSNNAVFPVAKPQLVLEV